MKAGLQFTGLTELEREFKAIPFRARRRVYRIGLAAAGRVAAKKSREILHTEGTTETGQLAKSLGVKTAKDGLSVAVGARGGFAIPAPPGRSTKTGMIDPVKYAHLVELGTSKSRAKPYLRPGMDNNPELIIEALSTGISRGLDRIITREMRRKR